jgi:hypothetical protein
MNTVEFDLNPRKAWYICLKFLDNFIFGNSLIFNKRNSSVNKRMYILFLSGFLDASKSTMFRHQGLLMIFSKSFSDIFITFKH